MRVHRAATLALGILGGVVATVCLFIGLTVTIAKTRWGGERIRRMVVTRVNQQIQGHLDIGRLSFGGDRLTVWDVGLRDPEGRFVASAVRAEVDVALLRLLHQEVRLQAALDTPVVDAVSDGAGMNLSRALAPRNPSSPKPAAPKTTAEGWVIRLDRFALTGGAVTLATGDARPETRLHLTDLHALATARYATGNANLDLTIRLDGQSVQAPTGPIRLTAEASRRDQAVRLAAEGALLGGTLRARANVDGRHPSGADARVNVDIPALALAGQSWGPLRIEGTAQPGAVPRLTVRLDLPGVNLQGDGGPPEGDDGVARFAFKGRLSWSDLGLTARAIGAVKGTEPPRLEGRGTVDLALGGPLAGAPASWTGEVKIKVPRLVSGDTTVSGLALSVRAAHLARDPREATLALAVDGVRVGKTLVRGIDVSGAWRGSELTADAKLSAPGPLRLVLAGRLDGDQKGLRLVRMDLTFPGAAWALDTTAMLRFAGDTVSLNDFRLVSREQSLVIDGHKEGERIAAHVALERLRLEKLAPLLIDPSLRLGGLLGVDVKASGSTAAPRVVASVRLQQGRAHGFTEIGAKVDATLAQQRVEGTMELDAPFATAAARFALPVNVTQARDAPFDVRLDVSRLSIAEALRAAAAPARGDGHLTVAVHARGSLGDPRVDATVTGTDLKVDAPAGPAASKAAVDLGHARLKASYAHMQARADLDFAASHGGTLRADAAAQLDLSYPRVTEGIVIAKVPVRGKVLAQALDAAWLAQFSDRVQTVAGQVNADATLAGTIGDPRFIGDVRWENGKMIATARPAEPTRARAAAGQARHAH